MISSLKKVLIDSLTKEKVRIWTELAEELKAAGIMCGEPHNHSLRAINTVIVFYTN